jgi:hypothetical protein
LPEDFGKIKNNSKFLQNFKIHLAFLEKMWYNTACCINFEDFGVIFVMNYCEMSREALENELQVLQKKYNEIKESGLKLDISRGKPCTEQLNLSDGLLTVLQGAEDC